MSEFEQRINIDQVRVGLYIRLEDWMDHPFLFSSFKIRTEKQIQVLRSLGLQQVIYVREKSDLPPLPPPKVDAPPPPPPPPDPEVEAMWQAKKERREKLSRQREALGRCEKKFNTGVSTVKGLLRNLFSRPAESIHQAREVVSDMVDSLLREKDVVLHLMNAKSGDEGAYYHALNVTMLALILGKEAKFSAMELRDLGLGTLLHDMGKERVPSQILLKKTPWTSAERNFYQQHVLYGVEMVRQLPDISAGALEVLAMHHELLDGTGFPGKLKAGRIGRFARIACIVNTFDNYCNRTNLADSMTPVEAIAHMFKREQGKYDPELMQFFIRSMGVYPPGSIVQLSNGLIGLVMSVNPGKLLHPSVLLYDPDVPKEEALWLDLAEEPGLSVEKALRPGDLDKAVFDYLEPRSRVSYYADNNDSTSRTQ
jgi:HD-GYP domain-containing protein (c-di-GMP phosphodiesterase class II)